MTATRAEDDILAGLSEAQRAEVKDEKLSSDSINHSSLPHLHEDGTEVPTEEDLVALRRVPDRLPARIYSIAYVELAERFSYYGSIVVFTNFIQQPLPPGSRTGAGGEDGQSGALGMGQRASTGIVTFNNFWSYVTPLIGGYLADTYFGRFRTVAYSIVIALVGHVLLITSSLPDVIAKPKGALGCFVIAVIVMGIGTGGFKSNISPLIAEQYTGKLHVRTIRSGERVLIDPALTTSRIYMYFYFFINVGALVGQIGMTYSEKYVGFWLAFLLPTVVFLTAPLVLFLGRKVYIRSPPQGSVLASALRVYRYAARGTWSWNTFETWRRQKADGFWERAKPSRIDKEHGSKEGKPAWVTWDDKWVDEVRRGFKACIVFVWYPVYWLSYNQIGHNLTSQAATMETHGLPNDVLANLNPFALLIFIPICDLLVYPALQRANIRFTPIKKITAGFYTCAAAMIWAAVLQHYLYKTNPCGYHASTCEDDEGNKLTSPLNVWIQSGTYVLIALSEIFASITGLEYAFTKAPKNMRSFVMGIFLLMSAISSAIGEAFVSLSEDPLLVWNYGAMGVFAFVAGTGFWFSFRRLDAEEEALNAITDAEGINVKSNESNESDGVVGHASEKA
ncbi:PTR2-domain-containing protein [Fomitiporia mediterranea MF3/22]|uniref:PTR2-domain-containing protein n=1 Tax=Fomitiporia mediterranea (strain MF3/22) TaxID=694068 RepID=UPI0004408560|nr:PTR2-domain-containing protein [Fomitiporia mediterranea MF3/22]EJD07116.1 PTR2-domain-containing protein [Fomitiporia mediterranea MF3/22]